MNGIPAALQYLTLSSAGVWVLVAIAITTAIKSWPILRRIQLESDSSLRRDLLEEVRKLRADVISERRSCDERIEAQDKRHSAELAELRGEVNGLRRQLLQMQQMTGQPIILDSPRKPRKRS